MDLKISLPLLPLRDIVVYPNMVIPLFVGRDKSISALNEVMKKDKKIILVTQKNSEIDDPKKTDVFMYGCEGNILQLLKLPDGTVKVLVEGIKRVKILDFKDNEKFITCEYTHYKDVINNDEDLYPLAATAIRRLEKLTSINKKISNETINTIKQLKDPSQIADNIASHINATISEKQQIFETAEVLIYGDGEQKRSFTYISDIVNGLSKLMDCEESGTFNFGSNNTWSINNVIEKIENKLESKAKISIKERAFRDVDIVLPNLEKSQSKLGWTPLVDLDTGLDETITWYRKYKEELRNVKFKYEYEK